MSNNRPWNWTTIFEGVKAFASVLIPIAIGLVGASIQRSIATQNVNKDYVALAVSILTQPEESVDPGLRNWAVDLLNENSPKKLEPETLASLKTGDARLPATTVWRQGPLIDLFQGSICLLEDPPSPEVHLDPGSTVQRGEAIEVSFELAWEECEPLGRLKLDGLTLVDVFEFPATVSVDSSTMAPGSHIFRLEVTPRSGSGWVTVWETVLTVE